MDRKRSSWGPSSGKGNPVSRSRVGRTGAQRQVIRIPRCVRQEPPSHDSMRRCWRDGVTRCAQQGRPGLTPLGQLQDAQGPSQLAASRTSPRPPGRGAAGRDAKRRSTTEFAPPVARISPTHRLPSRRAATQLIGGQPRRFALRRDKLPAARVSTEMPVSVQKIAWSSAATPLCPELFLHRSILLHILYSKDA